VRVKRSAKAPRPRRKARSTTRRIPRASTPRRRKNFGLDRFLGRKARVTSRSWDHAGTKRRGAALKKAGVSAKQLPAYTGYSWRDMQSSFEPGFIKKVMGGLKANPRKRRVTKKRNKASTGKVASIFRKLGFSAAASKQAAARVQKMSNPQRSAFSRKIAQLRREGIKAKQAVAIAFSEQRRGKLNPKRRRNQNDGLDAVAGTYEMFHGRDPRHTFEVKELVDAEPDDMAALGRLVSLKIDEPKEYEFVIQFVKSEEQPLLTTDSDANQLYIVGGDQSMEEILKSAGIGGNLDMVDIGEVSQVEYFTHKSFDNFAPVVYFHDFGEEDLKKNPRGKCRRPRLIYSRRNKKLHLVGGAYKIKKAGIIN
jgi:hypothetical protein